MLLIFRSCRLDRLVGLYGDWGLDAYGYSA